MNAEHSKEAAEYRLQQAHETLLEAAGLYELSFWRGTINRAYFAMFYAVLALAILRQQVTSKHSDREYAILALSGIQNVGALSQREASQ